MCVLGCLPQAAPPLRHYQATLVLLGAPGSDTCTAPGGLGGGLRWSLH